MNLTEGVNGGKLITVQEEEEEKRMSCPGPLHGGCDVAEEGHD